MPYLMVKNGKKTIALYEKLFDAELKSHEPFTEEMCKQLGFADDFNYENSTMHATIEIYGNTIYLSDGLGGTLEEGSGKVDILLDLDSKDQIEKTYNKAKELDCKIFMELDKKSSGAYYASFKDKFGIGWQLYFFDEEQ